MKKIKWTLLVLAPLALTACEKEVTYIPPPRPIIDCEAVDTAQTIAYKCACLGDCPEPPLGPNELPR